MKPGPANSEEMSTRFSPSLLSGCGFIYKPLGPWRNEKRGKEEFVPKMKAKLN
jgi:hypothetical protein